MANAIIAHNNLADSCTLTQGSWVSTLPLNNLKNRVQGIVARTTSDALSATKFLIEVPNGQITKSIGLINHNFSLTAKVRIRASTDDSSMATNVEFDTGWVDAWPSVYSTLNLEWENLNFWTGQYQNNERVGYTWNFIKSAPYALAAQYWLVEIDDTANDDNFIQIGRLFLGEDWQFQINMQYGASIAWEDNTTIDESLSGTEFFENRPMYRVARFSLNAMPESEAYGKAFDIIRRAGVSGEILFLYDPDDTLHTLRRQFRARLRTLSQIENPTVDAFSAVWEIKELL